MVLRLLRWRTGRHLPHRPVAASHLLADGDHGRDAAAVCGRVVVDGNDVFLVQIGILCSNVQSFGSWSSVILWPDKLHPCCGVCGHNSNIASCLVLLVVACLTIVAAVLVEAVNVAELSCEACRRGVFAVFSLGARPFAAL